MGSMRLDLFRRREGQSLLESALVLPLLLVMVFNAINLGYCFFAYLNLTTAPRQGAQYSIIGPNSIQGPDYPPASAVWSLVNEGISGAISTAANTPVQVCSTVNGYYNEGTVNQAPKCNPFPDGSTGSFPKETTCVNSQVPSPDGICPDPEAHLLVLNRVDIQYTITPLIPGAAFNMGLPDPLILHRYVYMRAE